MEQEVKAFIDKNRLIDQGDRIVVGVSGGADSICLMSLLHALQLKEKLSLYIVHVNHGLRGKEADDDEDYVREMCIKLGLHFHVAHFDVKEYAKRNKLSEEEAGRELRYQAFFDACKEYQCNKIAIAHNKDDQAETVLFHMFRGTGLKGLTGIPVSRELEDGIQIIRPLLCMSRNRIEEYLRERGLEHRTDHTNLLNEYSRNKLRNQLIPYVKTNINQGVVDHIFRMSGQLNEVYHYIDQKVMESTKQYVIQKNESVIVLLDVQNEDIVIQKGVIRWALSNIMSQGLKNLDACHIDMVRELFSLQVGRRVSLPGGVIARKRYDDVILEIEKDASINQHSMSEELVEISGIHEYESSNLGKTVKMVVKDYEKNMIIPKSAYTKWFDYDKIKNTIFIRTRKTGDYIQVTSSGGKKKIKDYFIDRKIPREERDDVLLLADGNHIMWIIGDRISEGYKVTSHTKRILVISLMEEKKDGNQ